MTGSLDLSPFLFNFNIKVVAFVLQIQYKIHRERKIILFFNLDSGIKYSQYKGLLSVSTLIYNVLIRFFIFTLFTVCERSLCEFIEAVLYNRTNLH